MERCPVSSHYWSKSATIFNIMKCILNFSRALVRHFLVCMVTWYCCCWLSQEVLSEQVRQDGQGSGDREDPERVSDDGRTRGSDTPPLFPTPLPHVMLYTVCMSVESLSNHSLPSLCVCCCCCPCVIRDLSTSSLACSTLRLGRPQTMRCMAMVSPSCLLYPLSVGPAGAQLVILALV